MNFLRKLTALVLRIFFRRVSVAGLENIPRDAPVIFAPNHPNSLVDPLFLLAFAPREVVFLAKEPLFRMPIIGRLVRWAGAIPVFRRQDQADMSRNHETFSRVHQLLARGGAVAIFPEGVSHNDPQLRPFKTGAARMALGATAMGPADRPVQVIPTGLYYTAKATFRSSALVYFGAPIIVPRVPLEADGEPPPGPVHELTTRLTAALTDVTLQADQHEALALITRAQRIHASGDPEDPHRELVDQFELRRRFLAGYAVLRARAPARLAQLQAMVEQYEAKLAAAGLAPESITPGRVDRARLFGYAIRTLALFVIMLPLALAGIVIHFPAYRLIGPLATGLAKDRDVIATAKILAAATAFPLTWILVSLVIGWTFGAGWAVMALIATPGTGYVALVFLERLDRVIGSSRALALLLLRPIAFKRLVAERRLIREAILRANDETAGGIP
jgi:glycerol-3-phosphate O-acyltransferase/dihydroxyacetone phosphate acyltransferase